MQNLCKEFDTGNEEMVMEKVMGKKVAKSMGTRLQISLRRSSPEAEKHQARLKNSLFPVERPGE